MGRINQFITTCRSCGRDASLSERSGQSFDSMRAASFRDGDIFQSDSLVV